MKDYLHQLAILGTEGIQKSGSEEPLQSILLLSFSVGAREKGLDDRNCLKSMTHHAAGIGSCAQSGMSIQSYLSVEMHLGKFPDQAEVHSWIVNFRVEVCAKAKNPMRALQWIKEIGAAKSLDDFITPKSMTVKDFPDCEELDMMMAAALKCSYDIVNWIYEMTERRAVTRQKGEQLLHRAED